ncbi:hypothetical protein HDU98_008829 [Podochytrium sp. JEL0797]|nr:hypothetical protein HDU98_008829 [Podochytrium sp. JEL0797]
MDGQTSLDEATRGAKGKTLGAKGKGVKGRESKLSKKGKAKETGLAAVADLLGTDKNAAATARESVVKETASTAKQIDEEDEISHELEDDGWESDLAIDFDALSKSQKLQNAQIYATACKVLGVVPVTYFENAVRNQEPEVILKHRGVGPKGAQAIAAVLESNTSIAHLDLSNNFIEGGGASIGRSLQINRTLLHLDLTNNKLALQGGAEIAEMLAFNGTLQTLILKGNALGDKEATLLAEGLKQNSSLQVLDLSYNKIGDLGSIAIGAGLVSNDSLKELNMAWNEIRVRGANGFLNHLKDNSSLATLTLQDNGFGENGQSLSLFLSKSNSITNLNISRMRIHDASMVLVAKGLEQNYSIKELDVSENPVGDIGMLALFKSIVASNCIKKVLMRKIVITKEMRLKLEDLKNEKPEVEIVE